MNFHQVCLSCRYHSNTLSNLCACARVRVRVCACVWMATITAKLWRPCTRKNLLDALLIAAWSRFQLASGSFEVQPWLFGFWTADTKRFFFCFKKNFPRSFHELLWSVADPSLPLLRIISPDCLVDFGLELILLLFGFFSFKMAACTQRIFGFKTNTGKQNLLFYFWPLPHMISPYRFVLIFVLLHRSAPNT